jgi:hypothetical protein
MKGNKSVRMPRIRYWVNVEGGKIIATDIDTIKPRNDNAVKLTVMKYSVK